MPWFLPTLPAAPSRATTDPRQFVIDTDAFLGALGGWGIALTGIEAELEGLVNSVLDAALGLGWTVITEDYEAEAGDLLEVDTSGGAVTITLPEDGGAVSLRDPASSWAANPVTIEGNGRTIAGEADLIADVPALRLNFYSAGDAWRWTQTHIYGGSE